MADWYFCRDGITLEGPLDQESTTPYVRENAGAWCWRAGFSDWRPIHTTEIRRLKKDGITPFPAPPIEHLAPKPSLAIPSIGSSTSVAEPHSLTDSQPSSAAINASSGFGSSGVTDGLDYKIVGAETQFLEVELDPGESVIAEAGAMMYKQPSVSMETVFGDGSGSGGGFLSSLMSAGKRLLTNESLFTTVFTQSKGGKGIVAFGAPFPGTIMPINLSDWGGKVICQKDSFLAAAKGVQVGIHFQRRILTGLFGGEGFIMQSLEGDGWAFVHMGGTLRQITLAPGETIQVDTGCLAAMTGSVDFDIQQAGGIKTMLFGGEGFFLATLTGPGTVWLQSLPFSRLAGRMLSAGTGGSQGEGSVLNQFLPR